MFNKIRVQAHANNWEIMSKTSVTLALGEFELWFAWQAIGPFLTRMTVIVLLDSLLKFLAILLLC